MVLFGLILSSRSIMMNAKVVSFLNLDTKRSNKKDLTLGESPKT